MADNVVEVVITGKDDTGAAYTSAAAQEKAFADLTDKNAKQFQRNWDQNRRAVLRGHDALLQAARAEMEIDKEARKLDQIERDMSGRGNGGFLTRLLYGSNFAGGGNGAGGLMGGGEGLSGGLLGGIVAGIPAAEALVAELVAVGNGFAAAGAGAGAFYALSHNALMQLQQDVGKLQSGQEAVQLAANLEKLYPSAAHLKALDNAKEKLKALQLGMGQDAGPAAKAMQAMGDEWHKLQNQFAPTAFKVLGDAFKTIAAFMPALIPLAQAFAGALDPMLKQLGKFAQSQGFQDWLKKFTALVGPATTAIGHGVALLAQNFARLLTTMSAKDVVNGINIAFRILNGTLGGFIWVVVHLMHSWDEFSGGIVQGWHNIRQWTLDAWHAIDQVFHNIAHAFDNVKHAGDNFSHAISVILKAVVGFFASLPGRIVSALAALPRMLFSVGQNIVMGLIHGLESMAGSLVHAGLSLAGSLWHSFTGLLGIHSPSTVFFEHGQNIVRGLVNGLRSEAPTAVSAMRQLGLAGLPGGVGARGFGPAGGATVIQLQLTGSGPFFEALKNEIRVRGGGGPNSVQVALGQNH